MSEQRNIHTEGIIIRKQPVGENDIRITLYSPLLGKIQASARGGRKINSSLGGHTETLNICRLQLYKSSVRYTIVQCQVINHFKNIRSNYERAITAGQILEIFNRSTHSSEHAGELFALLQETLYRLESSEQYFFALESFKINMLRKIGVLPDLKNCINCHERWSEHHQIWLEKSGYLRCQNCRNTLENKSSKKIEFGIIKLLHYLEQPLDLQTKKLTINPTQKQQLEHITGFFLEHFLS